ncbi:MAG: thioredoxin family protein [Prevotella sp.]|nr:thioredoxin family protein [Prevotella sp.]
MNRKTIIKIILAVVVILVVMKGVSFVYDKIQVMNAPTMQEISEANPWTVPADWFKTDTITIKGHIEDYDAEQFGFTSMACYYDDVFEKGSTVLVLDIADDGTFCKKFLASYPVCNSFIADGSKVFFNAIPFFARPGETIDITVRKASFWRYECVYNNGSSRDVERWLRTSGKFEKALSPLWKFEGKFDDANKVADEVWKRLMAKLQSISRSEDYTPMEVQLALADIQANFGMDYIGCIERLSNDLVKYEKRDSTWHAEILDSAEWNKYLDSKTYEPMRRIDYDNPLLFASSSYYFLQNRIQYAKPVREGQYKGLFSEGGGMEINVENFTKKLVNGLAALREFMGTDKDNLLAQMCVYKDMVNEFDTWREEGDIYQRLLADTTITEAQRKENLDNWPTLTKMWPLYLDAIKNPYIRQKAEQFRDRRLAQKDLTTPLPSTPEAELIRSLVAKYPGRILFIDFWGMSCGPCRGAIQESKELRAEIAKRDDVKLVFIAGERTKEGSDAYKQYVAEWLANEETVCLPNAEFRRLQELFQFNGIPHYETITPDCRRVREDLSIGGYHNFNNDLERVLEKLK